MTYQDHNTFVRKAEEDTPDDIVTKAIEDFTGKVEDRLSKVEKAADTSALVERLDRIEAKTNRAKGAREADKEPSEIRKAFSAYLAKGNDAGPDVLKALTTLQDPKAGYLAPPEMASEIIKDLVEVSPIRQFASVRSTSSPSVIYPRRTEITNARWRGETMPQQPSEPAFAQAEVDIKSLDTYVDLSNELLSDSAGQAEAEVRAALAEDFGQKEGMAFVGGDGILAPLGILRDPSIQEFNSGSATGLTADALVALMYQLPAMYRNRGAWALNSTTLAAIRLLKDGDGRFLWQPSFQLGQPETILGRPVVEMVDMPDLEANATPIVYGDWSGYRIVDHTALSILVNPYLLATNGMTRIHATRRVGGRVIQAAKFRKLKIAA
ncbi:phage major capsid protein [uncultured Jannaschia sp.]|uniref:phage major capsid protein n=1 Tax=uncultured Jannaschia sp. TaxID=293347 RepID=UPI00262CBEA7|nr:phage major capsid protein [uncultured Jannaschia sp.]